MQSSRKHSTNNFKILYYNARSLLPKFDELLISVDNYQPDIVCITESWLCSDIHDSEFLLPGYQCLRYDRNRHGGGVLMYVLHKYILALLLIFCILSIVILNQLIFLSFSVLYLLVISI